MVDRPARVIFLAMYAMEHVDSGATMRVYNLRRTFAQFTEVDCIFGERRERSQAISKYLDSGKVQGASGLFVEASTSWCTFEDLRFMAACRTAGVPVLTWIPDAYQLYPHTREGVPLHKRLISSLLWRLSVWGYFRNSDAIGTQSESFSKLFNYPPSVRRVVLEPAASQIEAPPISAQAGALLYTGNAKQKRFGVELLVEAAEIARRRFPDLRLLLVCPHSTPHSGPPPEELYIHRPWVKVTSLPTYEIPNLLPQVRALVNPLLDEPYHRIQIPTKVMDYLGYGRPILATDLPEVSHIVRDNDVGLVVPATVQGLAEGIWQLYAADLTELNRMGQNALRAVREKHSWQHRVRQILDTFEEISRR